MRILMVCLGNICRSPMAEGILRNKLQEHRIEAEVDSAGTSAWHIGEAPDDRAVFTCHNNSIDISDLAARQFKTPDFDDFDRILVMDQSNYSDVVSKAKTIEHRQKVEMILNLSNPHSDMPVPDPYYGGDEGFNHVFELLDAACEALVKSLP